MGNGSMIIIHTGECDGFLFVWAEQSTENAVEFIFASMDKRALAPGVIVGADTAYWADAIRFAGSIVAR